MVSATLRGDRRVLGHTNMHVVSAPGCFHARTRESEHACIERYSQQQVHAGCLQSCLWIPCLGDLASCGTAGVKLGAESGRMTIGRPFEVYSSIQVRIYCYAVQYCAHFSIESSHVILQFPSVQEKASYDSSSIVIQACRQAVARSQDRRHTHGWRWSNLVESNDHLCAQSFNIFCCALVCDCSMSHKAVLVF
jgi:hypothetical protein